MLFGVSGALSSFSAHPRMPTPSPSGSETIEVFQLITHTFVRTTLKMVQAEVRCSSGLVRTRFPCQSFFRGLAFMASMGLNLIS